MVNEMSDDKVKLTRGAKQRFYDVQYDLLNSLTFDFLISRKRLVPT